MTQAKKQPELLENLDLVFDNLNDGFLLISLTGKILAANKAILRLGGYKKEEILGKNAMRLVKIFPAKSLKRIASSFLDAAKGIPGDKYELEAKTKTGQIKMLELSNSLIMNGQKKLGVVVAIRDITHRVDFEKELEESEKRFRILFDSSRDAIMTLEPPKWNFTSGNQATVEIFGCKDEKEFTAMSPMQLSPKYQPDGQLSSKKAKAMIMSAMKKGSNSFEWIHKRKTGEEFPATVLLTRVELDGKKFLQATVRDISSKKTAESKLKEKIDETEKINQLMVGRELKMVELKKKIKQLEKKLTRK